MKSIFYTILFGLVYQVYIYFHPECKITKGALVLNMLLIWWIFIEFSNTQNGFQVFLMEVYSWFLALQDEKTLHIGKEWILYSLVVFIVLFPHDPGMNNWIGGLLFSIPAVIMSKWKGWLGSADGWFLALFGFLLGVQRMIVCMFITCITGFLYAFAFKKEKLPFLSFLAFGLIASFLRGYFVYAKIFL